MPRLFLLALTLLLGACSRGPDQAQLQADLQRQLAQAFPAQVLSITELQRRGSATDAHAPEGEARVVVYFDAQLWVEQDQDFGSWDSPGVASLISALGAGPRGVSGIENGGNHRGDQLKVHGSLIYRQADGAWHSVVPQGFSAPRAPMPEQAGGVPSEQLVSAIGTALKLGDSGNRERAIIRDELGRSLNNIQGRLNRLHSGYVMAGGPQAGQYARFADALSGVLRDKGIELLPLTTAGGLDNLRMLRRGEAVLALSQSDVAQQAVNGSGLFAKDGADISLRALASLYPEPLHVLVRSNSEIYSVAELRDKRVSLGLAGSASRDSALAVLSAHGLGVQDLAAAPALDMQQALTRMRDGELDALFQVIGAPADQIRAASEALDLRLLPLDPDAIARVVDQRPGTFAFQLPAGTYPQQPAAVATLAVSSLLLTDTQLTNREAEELVRQVFSLDAQWLQRGSVQGSQLSLGNAQRGIGIPLHEGAQKALQALEADSPRGVTGTPDNKD